jgi:hypothetical protein
MNSTAGTANVLETRLPSPGTRFQRVFGIRPRIHSWSVSKSVKGVHWQDAGSPPRVAQFATDDHGIGLDQECKGLVGDGGRVQAMIDHGHEFSLVAGGPGVDQKVGVVDDDERFGHVEREQQPLQVARAVAVDAGAQVGMGDKVGLEVEDVRAQDVPQTVRQAGLAAHRRAVDDEGAVALGGLGGDKLR